MFKVLIGNINFFYLSKYFVLKIISKPFKSLLVNISVQYIFTASQPGVQFVPQQPVIMTSGAPQQQPEIMPSGAPQQQPVVMTTGCHQYPPAYQAQRVMLGTYKLFNLFLVVHVACFSFKKFD